MSIRLILVKLILWLVWRFVMATRIINKQWADAMRFTAGLGFRFNQREGDDEHRGTIQSDQGQRVLPIY